MESKIGNILSESKFSEDIVDGRLRIRLSPEYKKRFIRIREERGESSREAIISLIDLYYMENDSSLQTLRRALQRRIKRGIGYNYIIQLRILFFYLYKLLEGW